MRSALILLGMMIEEGLRPDFHPDDAMLKVMLGTLLVFFVMDIIELAKK